MNELIVKNEVIESNIKIENMIYEIRGVQVMLDSDLALLYETETKRINEAVRRNKEKFPEKYSWILTDEESKFFLVAKCDQKIETRGGRYKNPRVFTEQSVAMLASILKTSKAIKITLAVMDAFVNMRHFLMENKNIYQSLNNINNKLMYHENKMLEYDDKFDYIFSKFDKKEQLLLKEHTYDAYVSVLDILNNAEKEIIIIDNYADIALLDLIRNIKYQVILITKNSPRLSNMEIEKYNNQYHNLKVIRDNSWHDCYFIIDKNEIYLSGTSINNIGNNTSMIIKLEDENVKKIILQNINNILGDDINNTDNYT